ncbi:MAG: hypothetical protein LBO63_00690 [Oscillospiraceae bacterium]|jgi:hypothetical protein|nr:hypothetical protein [Oscillospiraceae bacterium]
MRTYIRLSKYFLLFMVLAAAVLPVRAAEYSALDDAPPVRSGNAQDKAKSTDNARFSVIFLDDDVIYRARTRNSCLSDKVYLNVYRRILESRR